MAKKAVTKKVSSTKKNSKVKKPVLNRRSFTLGLLGILIISIIGATGYSAYNSRNDINAKASGYLYFGKINGVLVSGCRKQLPNGSYTLFTKAHNETLASKNLIFRNYLNGSTGSVILSYSVAAGTTVYKNGGTMTGPGLTWIVSANAGTINVPVC